MTNQNLTIDDYKKLLRQAQTQNRHLSWKILLNEATSRRFNLRDVVGALSQITGGATFFLDRDLSIQFFEGSSCLGSQLAKALIMRDTLQHSAHAQMLPREGDPPQKIRLDNGDLCYCSRFTINTIEPFYLLLLTGDDSLDHDISFLFDAARDCFTAVDLHRKRSNIPFGDFKVLLHLILNRQLEEWDEIDAYLKRLPNPPKHFMSLGVVRIEATRRNAINASDFLSKLRSFFPDCSATTYNNSFVVLISSNEKSTVQPRPTFDEEAFSAFLFEYDAYAAFSNATQKATRIRTLYLLTESTLRLGRVLSDNPQQRILYFENYAEYVMVELTLTGFKTMLDHEDFLYLTNPSAVQIYWHDKRNGTDLQTVLFNYCLFNGNISAAANASFMHRNTFAAKIAEIRRIISDDLNDTNIRQRMIFSGKVFQFITRYYDNHSAVGMIDQLNMDHLQSKASELREDTGEPTA